MNKKLPVQNMPTVFLRVAILLIGVAVLAICLLVVPRFIVAELAGDFDYGWLLLGLYVPAIPFFLALYQALKLLDNIDHNSAFSQKSVEAFRAIKYCALSISGLFAVGSPYFYYLADRDDAPGVLAIALVIIFASLVIATFSAVLERLVYAANQLKTENDLTV